MDGDETTPQTLTEDTPQEVTQPTADTPEQGPDGTAAGQPVDYEKRYNDLRPEWDRTKGRLSTFEQAVQALNDPNADPDTRQQAAQTLGLQVEFVSDDTDDENIEGDEPQFLTRQEFVQWQEEQRQQAQAEAARQAESRHASTQLDAIEKSIERELSERELKIIFSYAVANRDDNGMPDVKGAWEELTGLTNPPEEKPKPKPGRPPLGGTSGASATQVPNLDNEAERHAYLKQRAAELEAQG